MPGDIRVGETYLIQVKFIDITPLEGEGTVGLQKVSTTTLVAKVISKQRDIGKVIIWILVFLLIICAFIILIIYFKTRNRRISFLRNI